MTSKQSDQTNPGGGSLTNDTDAAVNAMRVAMSNREAVMKSYADSRDQVLKLLEAQREEALKPMLHAKALLRQARASAGLTNVAETAPNRKDTTSGTEKTLADARQELRRTFNNAFTVLLALQGAGGAAADSAREQAVAGIADALDALIEAVLDERKC
jgi:hypothetical protein